jgi:replicative DNA helicase
MNRLRKATLPANLEAIPEDLRSVPRWIVWDYFDKGEKKLSKVPLLRDRDGGADYTDPAEWRTFDEAVDEARRRSGGIGFVFADSDDLIGVDLDGCYSEAGELKPWGAETLERFSSTWAEKSPSGSGIHFIGRGDRIVGKTRVDKKTRAEFSETEGVERYSQSRWFTFSGNVVNPAPVADVREAMAWLGERFFSKPATPKPPADVGRVNAAAAGSDRELDVELGRLCLGYLTPTTAADGEAWRRAGMAAKAVGEELKEPWFQFSRQWAQADEAELEDRWARFSPGTVSLKTLIGMAVDDSGKTARELIDEARRNLGRPTSESKRTLSAEEVSFLERVEAALPAATKGRVLPLVLATDPTLAFYNEVAGETFADLVAAPPLDRVLWARVAKIFSGRVLLIAGDRGDDDFRESCRALLETKRGPASVSVVGPEAWETTDDLPTWFDENPGGNVSDRIVERLNQFKTSPTRWLAGEALGATSPSDTQPTRRAAVERCLELVGLCRGPRAALDVEDLLQACAGATGYPLNKLEALAEEERSKRARERDRERLARRLGEIAERAGAGAGDPEELLDDARKIVDDLTTSSAVVAVPALFDVAAIEAEARLVKGGFSLGWGRFDADRVRLRPKEFVGVAARPGQGKTSVLVWLLWQLLKQTTDGVVVFVSHEETKISLLYRLFALASAVLVPEEKRVSKSRDSKRWNRGDVRDWLSGEAGGSEYRASAEKIALLDRARELIVEKSKRLVVVEERGAGAARVAKICRALHDAHGVKGVLLDYLQKLPHDGPDLAKGRRDMETAWACRALRERVAIPFDCPVVVAAQVNREALRDGWGRRLLEALDPSKKTGGRGKAGDDDPDEKIRRVDRVLAEARPAPHMLRDGGIEHEADLILGTQNPAADMAWDKERRDNFIRKAWPGNPTPLDVGILKNRSGADGEWIRLRGDYGAGYFVDDAPPAGGDDFADHALEEDGSENPFG